MGVFAAGGAIALAVAGLFLFDDAGMRVDLAVLLPTALVAGSGSLLAGRLAWRARTAPPHTGVQTLVGATTVIHAAHGRTGQVHLEGGWWNARSPDTDLHDGQTVRVTYFNVVDPVRSVVAIENHVVATSQIAQTTLRSILGQVDLDELLIKRDEINQRLQQIIDDVTNPWGVKVTLVEVKDVELPDTMRRAMASQAEAERDRRAKVIHAVGEFEAAADLGRAAEVLELHPAAMQLRVLSTMAEVSAEKNSTLIFPLPIELLRLVDTLAARSDGRTPPRPSGVADPVAEPDQ